MKHNYLQSITLSCFTMDKTQNIGQNHFRQPIGIKQEDYAKLLNESVETNKSTMLQGESSSIEEQVLSLVEIKKQYRLHQKILLSTKITQHMRARLRSFLMFESSKQFILRETCTLACTYIDLYFLNEGLVNATQFQSLAIGCLILAAKFIEGKFPTISFDTFSREELLTFEKKIMKRLDYNVSPPTYHTFAERIIYAWDLFVQEQKIYNLKFTEIQKIGANSKIQAFYQQLDLVYMVLKSLDYEVQIIVVTLFYLNARILNTIHIPDSYKLSDAEFTKIFFPSKDNFLGFFKKFLPSYSNKNLTLNIEIAKYLKHFLIITPGCKEWPIRSTADNRQIVEMMRQWDRIQTAPANDYQIVKQIIKKVNGPATQPRPLLPAKLPKKK